MSWHFERNSTGIQVLRAMHAGGGDKLALTTVCRIMDRMKLGSDPDRVRHTLYGLCKAGYLTRDKRIYADVCMGSSRRYEVIFTMTDRGRQIVIDYPDARAHAADEDDDGHFKQVLGSAAGCTPAIGPNAVASIFQLADRAAAESVGAA